PARLRLPGRDAPALADGARQRPAPAGGGAAEQRHRGPADPRAAPAPGRPGRPRGGAPARAVRGDAPARGHRPGARHRAAPPPHGRALRRAGRDHAGQPQRGAAADLAGDGHHDHLRHALDPGGGVPLPAGAGARHQTRPRARAGRVRPALSPAAPDPRDGGLRPHRRPAPGAAGELLMAAPVQVQAPAAPARPPPVPPPRRRRGRAHPPPAPAAPAPLAPPPPAARALGLPIYIAPTPVQVARELVAELPMLLRNFGPTAVESLIGFLAGNTLAILVAVVFVHSRRLEAAFYPIAVFVNTIPVLAKAPILILIFGLGLTSKVVIAAFICFFPTLANMVRGLQSVNPQSLELMRVLSASRAEVFWKLRVPSSLPFLFSALKIASTTSVLGAIVGEWIGADLGLGALIIEATHNFRSPLLYATIFVASGWAVAFFAVISLAERLIVTWKPGEAH